VANREEIIRYIFDYFGEEFYEKSKRKDEYINGVQLRGADKVEKIALGVSANAEFLEKSCDWGAQLIIVHHGIYLNKLNHYLNPIIKKRLKVLFDNDVTLMGFHYILDAHEEIGNNVQILKRLGAKIIEPFYDGWGWIGELPKGEAVGRVVSKLAKIFNHQPTKYLYGKRVVKKIAVVSGGGTPKISEMPEFLEKEFDLYITGEVRESTSALIKEAGINYVVFGHYDTEKFGVIALGELIKKRFSDLEVKFIDVPNIL
jgi:dinuclear metal center YbgI/SA1388 family protein